jgi:hypothetical protein
VVRNNVSGGFSVTLKTSAGTGITVPNGTTMFLRCDGTDVVDAFTRASSLSLGAALSAASGGTGLTSPGASGNLLTSDGTTWTSAAPAAVVAVTSLSGGTTGLTPSTPTTGAVVLAGTLEVDNGGTGQTSYTDGQLLIGNTTGNTLTKATLTAGTGITITNGAGSITIEASSAGGAQDYIVQSYGIV